MIVSNETYNEISLACYVVTIRPWTRLAEKESIVFGRTIDFKIFVVSDVNICFDSVERVNFLKNAKVNSIYVIIGLNSSVIVRSFPFCVIASSYICVALNSRHAECVRLLVRNFYKIATMHTTKQKC